MTKKDIIFKGVVVGEYEPTGNTLNDARAVEAILKEKGLYEEVSVNDAMFGQANSFAGVAEEIYKKGLEKEARRRGDRFSPFIVNATFGIEVYLKTVHNLYGKNVKGHNLTNLYKGIPNNAKDVFREVEIDTRPLYKLEDGMTFELALDQLKKAFEQWRYIYEHNNIGFEIQSIRYSMHICHETCIRLREKEIGT